MDSKRADDAAMIFENIGWIHVAGPFDPEMEDIIKPLIFRARQNHPEVRLLIDSNGGNFISLVSIQTALKLVELPSVGLVMGRALSAGFYLLQHCDKRLAVAGSFLMPHWGTTGFSNMEIAAMVRGESWPLDNLLAYTEAAIAQTHKRSGQSIELLHTMFEQERKFTAKVALGFGFIDKIVDPEDVPKIAKRKSN